MRYSLIFSLISLLFTPALAGADQGHVQFSAELFQSMPQQEPQQGRIYVGGDSVRTDMNVGGRSMIQIVDMKQQTAYMLDPDQKSYVERSGGTGEMMPGVGGTAQAENPCAGMQNITCKRIGMETVNGRPTEKWELENTRQGQSGKMTVWLDQARRMPIRQEMPDGSTMEMKLIGKETLDGRETEKWEMKATRPGGQSSVSYQWFDPQLKINIRQEMPGGFISELRNIKVGTQPADLFIVPPGYKMMSIPEGDVPGRPGTGAYP